MIRLYTGYDKRESAGWHAFTESLIAWSNDVALLWLAGEQKDGTNAFTYERFRIMEKCNWAGWAIFMDGADMLLRAPLDELWARRNSRYAIQVVKHDYRTRHPRKYVGTEMESPNEDYPRKNWSSLMLINCGHMAHFTARETIRQAIANGDGKYLHRISWVPDELIGGLPVEWNHLVGEQPFNPNAKLVHFTLGIPGFDCYADCDYADEWRMAYSKATNGLQYQMLEASAR